jgi:agmatinase
MSQSALFQPPWNFLGLPDELADTDRARAWVLPIPFESTTSYGAGTRHGPAAIIAASRQVEWFDREFDCEPCARLGIHTLAPLAPVHRAPEAMVAAVARAVAAVLGGSPAPSVLAVLGGEHTISAGEVRGLAEVISPGELVAVQIDAHADLRDCYQESPYSHACAARRILEVCPLFQIGIRNLSAEEEQFRRQCDRLHTVFAEELRQDRAFLDELARFVGGKSVFLTIDLDGLDPSIMPAVGTPEPDGLSWAGLLDIVRVVCRRCRRLPLFDVVELAPIPGLPSPDFLAARLVYKIISLALLSEGRGGD